jgi:hypothetical protein
VSAQRPPSPGPLPAAKRKRRPPPPDAVDESADGSVDALPDESGGETDASASRVPVEELPAFARGFPSDETLDGLVAAFEAGDYARVRAEAPALAKQTAAPAVRRAARELVKRLDPDPVAVSLLAVAGMLLAFLASWYWSHPHHP